MECFLPESREKKEEQQQKIKKMKNKTIIALALASSAVAVQGASLSTPVNTGNQEGWTVNDDASGIELGLRAKIRRTNVVGNYTDNGSGNGTYVFDVKNDYANAYANAPAGEAVWSFDFSVNTGGTVPLSGLTYEMTITNSNNPSETISFDFITAGENPNGAPGYDHDLSIAGLIFDETFSNSSVDYAAALSVNNIAQNSWNIGFFTPFADLKSNGQYEVTISAFEEGTEVATTSINVTQIPEPTTGLLALLGAGGLLLRRRRA